MITVRPAQPDDRERIWPLARDLATSPDVDHRAYLVIFDGLITTPGSALLVAEIESRVVGYVLAQRHHTFHANAPAVWVQEVMVDPDNRGHGVGRALMDAAERWAASEGAAYVALATRRAADFYLTLGYQESATYFKRTLPAHRL